MTFTDDSSLLSYQDTSQFLVLARLNFRFLIQSSKTLPVQLSHHHIITYAFKFLTFSLNYKWDPRENKKKNTKELQIVTNWRTKTTKQMHEIENSNIIPSKEAEK